eukprot:g6770.t1
MASEAPVPAAGISSVFQKKKGKGKKTKGSRGSNLNNFTAPTTEEKPKIEKLQEILGGPDPADDDGWADVVEKKSVVATGGKQVSDLINMTALMTEEESTAEKLEKQDIKQAFHDARTVKEAGKKEDAPDAENEEKQADEVPKSKGLSGDIFGGAARGGGGVGLGGGWKKRMEERELRQRQEELSVENTSAFPSLKDAMSAPVRPKQSAPDPDANRWARRTGGSAAAAAIKAALGRADEDKAAPAQAPAPKADAPSPAAPTAAAATSAEESKATEPVWVAPVKKSGADDTGESGADDAAAPAAAPTAAPTAAATVVAVEAEEEEAAAVVETDKAALVQQFGKKKKKKKKPVLDEAGAGGEP